MNRTLAVVAALAVASFIGSALLLSGQQSAIAAPPTPRPTPKPSGFPVPPPPSLPSLAPLPPKPTTEPAGPDLVRYVNVAGGWAGTLPATWRLHAGFDARSAIFTSFDPNTASFQKHDVRTRLGDVPRTEVRVNVDSWPNPAALDAAAFVAQDQANARLEGRVREISRDAITVAASDGLALTREELSSDGIWRTVAYYVFPSPNSDTMFVVSVVPGNSLHATAVSRFLDAFETVIR